jgi:periplasmic divalent cation tolerance protein
MFIAWTTVANRFDGESLAHALIEQRLAVCVQLEGPIMSLYRWDAKTEKAEEFRLSIKYLPAQAEALKLWVHQHHPSTTPEWVLVRAVDVGEKYLSWAEANSTNPPL